MLRYHKLLAGASWMAEYGDPDKPGEAEFLRRISPYHNLRPGVAYPEPFFVTSTKDDRVHPGHARKMAAKMEAMGLPFLYYENVEGGHAAAATSAGAGEAAGAGIHLPGPEADGLRTVVVATRSAKRSPSDRRIEIASSPAAPRNDGSPEGQP